MASTLNADRRRRAAARPLALGAAAVAFGLAGLLAAAPAPVTAQAASEMTAEERDAFRAEVRAFLLEEPEILEEAFAALEAKRRAAVVAEVMADIAADRVVARTEPEEADLVFVEFTDYDCGACRAAQPEIMAFLQEDGRVSHQVKALAVIGDDAAERFVAAVRLLEGLETSTAVHQRVMSQPVRLTVERAEEVAGEFDLDWGAIRTAMDGDDVADYLGSTISLATTAQIRSTPTFAFGGQIFSGVRSAAELAEMAAAIRASR